MAANPMLESLFGTMSEEERKQLMAQFGAQPEDKAEARNMALIMAGLSLLGTRRGQEMQGFGNAGMLGLNAYHTMLKDAMTQRGQDINQMIALRNVANQNKFASQISQLLGDNARVPMVPDGGSATFQVPGGAGALFDAKVQGIPAQGPTMPTRVPDPVQAASVRDRLAAVNLASMASGGKDFSAGLKFAFPDPIVSRPGAPLMDQNGRVINPNPKVPDGYFYDPTTNSLKSVTGAAEAEAKTRAIPEAVRAAYTPPQPNVDPGTGREVVPPGNLLQQLFPNGQYPYLGGASMPGAPGAPTGPGATYASTLTPGQRAVAQQDFRLYGPAAPPAPDSGPVLAAPGRVTRLGPGATSEYAERGKTLAEQSAKIDEQASASQQAYARNEEMRALIAQFKPGAASPFRRTVAQWFEAGGASPDTVNAIAGGNLAAMVALQKQVINGAFEATKQLTSRPAQAEVIMAATQGTANETMTKPAINAILDYNAGVHKYLMERQQARDAWMADPAHGKSLEGFEGWFNTNHPLTAYIPSVEELKKTLGGSASAEPKLRPGLNATERFRAQNVLKSGDAKAIEELRAMGYVQ